MDASKNLIEENKKIVEMEEQKKPMLKLERPMFDKKFTNGKNKLPKKRSSMLTCFCLLESYAETFLVIYFCRGL